MNWSTNCYNVQRVDQIWLLLTTSPSETQINSVFFHFSRGAELTENRYRLSIKFSFPHFFFSALEVTGMFSLLLLPTNRTNLFNFSNRNMVYDFHLYRKCHSPLSYQRMLSSKPFSSHRSATAVSYRKFFARYPDSQVI